MRAAGNGQEGISIKMLQQIAYRTDLVDDKTPESIAK
jgi:hypothetical protein